MHTIYTTVLTLLAALALSPFGRAADTATPRLRVSDNQRFLVTEQGKPFFWLGDTAWELFHRLNREEADRYLEDRAQKGYTVIQAVALAEEDGLNTPNPNGHRPLVDNDPTRPDVKDGPDNDYWDHVDYVVKKANALGLYIGLLPTWGDKWNKKWGVGPEIFTPQNAEVYGQWLGRRYKDKAIIWILGGDRPVENDAHRAIIAAMAGGLRKGNGGAQLMTFHPPGGRGSSEWFHSEPWLDFNMRQNGHVVEFNPRYAQTRADYDLKPTKPVLDGEPIYEDHPISFKVADFGHSVAADVRRPLYWDLFAGAFGHTYGHHSVWQMWSDRVPPKNSPLMPWSEAIQQPGAAQMQHAKHLMLSRPFTSRIPDDSIIVTDRVPTSVLGAGRYRFVATRDTDGGYAMVYVPVGRSFKVRMDVIQDARVKAWWFNPRDGTVQTAGEFPNTGEREFTPPEPGEMLDWVLVLDGKSKGFLPPGQGRLLWSDNFESYFEGQMNVSIVGGGPGPYDRQQNCQGFDHPGDPRYVASEASGKKSHIISRETAFNGSQSIKMQRNNGDWIPRPDGWVPRSRNRGQRKDAEPPADGQSARTARNELVTPELWSDGDDVWIGYALFLASKPEYGANGRWRNTPGANKTVLINQVTRGQPTFFFRMNWDADGGDYFLNCVQTSSVPLLWDEWNTIVIRLLWKGSGGKVQVWQNGTKVIDADDDHPQGGYNKFKFGQYGNTPAVGYPQIAFFDDLKIAVGTDLLEFVTPKRGAGGSPASSNGKDKGH